MFRRRRVGTRGRGVAGPVTSVRDITERESRREVGTVTGMEPLSQAEPLREDVEQQQAVVDVEDEADEQRD